MRDEAGSGDTGLEAQRAEVLRRFERAEPMPTMEDLLAMQREFPALVAEIAGMANAEAAVLLAIMRGEVEAFEPDPKWLAEVHSEADGLLGSLRRAEDDDLAGDDGVDGAGASCEPSAPGMEGGGPAAGGPIPRRPPRLTVLPGGRSSADPGSSRGRDAGR